MKIVAFQELYNTEFLITEALSKGQNWYFRDNFYSSLGKPKPSHTLLWFKNCRAQITDRSGKRITAEKNQIAYMAKGIEYTVEFFDTAPDRDDSVVFHFQIKGSDLEDIAPTLSPEICIKSVDASLALAMDLAAEEFHKNTVCTPLITSVIYQILALVCQKQKNRQVSGKYRFIREGIELMETNSHMTLSEIARVCGVSEGYFRKLFREYSGENPGEYRQKKRIEKAKQLLLLDTYSIGQIAEELSFSDIYHFSKTFKRFTGTSPLKYLRQNGLVKEGDLL